MKPTWKVIDAADGSVLARIETEQGRNYDVDPIATIGPHNNWINPAGTRAYLEGLTVPFIYVADPDGGVVIDTQTKQVVARIPTSENSSRSTSSAERPFGRDTAEMLTAVTVVAGRR